MSKNLNCSHQVRYYTIIFTIPMKSAHMTPQLHYTYTWIIDKLTNEKTGIFCDSPAESWQTLMVVLFRLSYLHSHRGQNSCSWPRIKSATFGNTMLSQSLEKKSCHWSWKVKAQTPTSVDFYDKIYKLLRLGMKKAMFLIFEGKWFMKESNKIWEVSQEWGKPPSLSAYQLLGATGSLYTRRLLLVPLMTEGSGQKQMHLLSSSSVWKLSKYYILIYKKKIKCSGPLIEWNENEENLFKKNIFLNHIY